jgi:hypothetical protein
VNEKKETVIASSEAIHGAASGGMDCFASLAMTKDKGKGGIQ